MDKSLKRKIGYVAPKKGTKAPEPDISLKRTSSGLIKPFAATVKVDKLTVANGQEPALKSKLLEEIRKHPVTHSAKEVCTWLINNKYFKVRPLCEALSLDHGNFNRTIHSEDPRFKPEVLEKIIAIIKNHGFGNGIPVKSKNVTK